MKKRDLTNGNITLQLAELMLPLLSNEQLRAQMTSSLKLFPGLLRRMTPEGKLLIAQENATYEDFARSLGINDDADEITLTRLIYQTQQPDDPSSAIKLDIDLAQASTEMKTVMDQSYRVGCLCTEYKNRLMWSHYADGHKGFCIEFDCSAEVGQILPLFPVIYSKDIVKMPWKYCLTPEGTKDPEFSGRLIQAVLTKDDVWKYENEWRILLPNTFEQNYKMPKISCVYLGAFCNKENEQKIIDIAKQNGFAVKRMTVDRGKFAFHTVTVYEP